MQYLAYNLIIIIFPYLVLPYIPVPLPLNDKGTLGESTFK